MDLKNEIIASRYEYCAKKKLLEKLIDGTVPLDVVLEDMNAENDLVRKGAAAYHHLVYEQGEESR